MVYHAHSVGYGFDVPPGLPVVSVSRNTLGIGERALATLYFLYLMRLSSNGLIAVTDLFSRRTVVQSSDLLMY